MIYRSDIVKLILLSAFAMVWMILSILFGEASIPISEVFHIMLGRESSNASLHFIVEERWLRTINAFISGGALALCGTILQSFFRNPLAGPGVLGVSSGASVGVAAAILASSTMPAWVQGASVYVLGFAGAFVVLAVLLILNRWIKGVTLLVVGLMLSFFSSSFVNLLLNLSNEMQTRKYVEWGFGSFSSYNPSTFYIYAGVLFVFLCIAVLYLSKLLNAWVYGEAHVEVAGFSLRKSRRRIIFLVGVMTALVTLQCGPVSFIGIAVPQMLRLFFKSTHHLILLTASIIGGGIMALLADFILRNAGLSLPLNAITALFGAPVILFVILRYSKHHSEL